MYKGISGTLQVQQHGDRFVAASCSDIAIVPGGETVHPQTTGVPHSP